MTKIAYNVCVLTVTYGKRWAFLKQILDRVLSFKNVVDIIVVDNAADYDLRSKINQLGVSTISLLQQTENIGSAGGYKAGLTHFVSHSTADFVWLLDDDNLPDEDALEHLMRAWPTIPLAEDQKALCSLRTDRKNHIRIAKGADPYQYYLVPDNFMGFHLFRILSNQYRKWDEKKNHQQAAPLRAAKLPYVPYGGLYLHKSLLQLIGYPDEQLFVYVDDSEYTYRITDHGGEIWLIPASKIKDVDTSQGIHYKRRFWRSAILDLWNFRTFYQVRNRLYFYSRHAIKNRFIFAINKWLYMTGHYFISILTGKGTAYKEFKKAVADGLAGRLGKKEDLIN
ncbi:glycosyltransferase [Olivibacter sp. XZL3]|uniref:glycosyltransferase n=1 Tax=Olivibacter sp. XZL3 TaxID=1735116 RepID=UPI00106683B2|nr:glycosyltransferase [Olivibacter sp. XZL3]